MKHEKPWHISILWFIIKTKEVEKIRVTKENSTQNLIPIKEIGTTVPTAYYETISLTK